MSLRRSVSRRSADGSQRSVGRSGRHDRRPARVSSARDSARRTQSTGWAACWAGSFQGRDHRRERRPGLGHAAVYPQSVLRHRRDESRRHRCAYPQFFGIAKELGAATSARRGAGHFQGSGWHPPRCSTPRNSPPSSVSRMVFPPAARRGRATSLTMRRWSGLPGFAARHVLNNSVIGPRRWADRFQALPGTTFDPADYGSLGDADQPRQYPRSDRSLPAHPLRQGPTARRER